ncbi:ATP-binding cassette domain-containing protein [Paenibacillus sp. GCM10012307]|uniref:ATP-binding cassette domain-containing protein n=1 Tax=Paenibacillus roseus TaxID=2798579 RepID=A0A934IYG4_9BACL|nr:ATP-binding cassette domain-containing protein [Paenibacillus roseus]MBJ6361561.1 ATP-binding cassette domain-containing protein [Paenibacillus roseus]
MQIRLDHVSFTYSRRSRKKVQQGPYVLKELDLTIESGEMMAIAGKSGSGKSTFLQLLKGFLAPTEGSVLLAGINPHQARRPELFDKVGFIFQYPEHQLFSTTVFDDIAFGLQSAGLTDAEKEAKVRQAMAAVQLDYETFKDCSPFELSGGEKRRVAIAGVVVLEPEVLILDEPTAGLDLQSRTALFDLLHGMNREQGITVMWVSHQLEEILAHATRLIALKEGRFLADGHPHILLSDPVLLEAFGWEEPPALAITRLLQELGVVEKGEQSRLWTPQEASEAIIGLLDRQRITV